MLRSRTPLIVGAGLAAAAVLATGAPAAAHPGHAHDGGFTAEDGARDTRQHGESSGHLPATRDNVRLVSKLELSNVTPGKIADVAVWGNYAYLNSWGGAGVCENNGVYVVDIRDPRKPKEVGFIRSTPGSYPGEGAQVVHLDTSAFKGDVLVTNNEICTGSTTGKGGIDLHLVNDPRKPRVLAQGVGDVTRDGATRGIANQTHSAFIWDAGEKAYAVATDNEEGTDVDIFDITDPRRPVLVAEYDLADAFPQILQDKPDNLTEVFLHDMVVKEIGGAQVMLLSYWDGGYVTLDATDPTKLKYIGDTDFAEVDPELVRQSGIKEKSEGNAHQAEFTKDNRYVVAADEDFAPNGVTGSADDSGAFFVSQGGGTKQLPSGSTTGTAVYVGQACNADTAVPQATAASQIAVAVRGVCTFTEKVANVTGKGYAAVVIVNREGSNGCAPFGMNVEGDTPAVAVDRRVGLGLFDLDSGYTDAACLAGTATELAGVSLGQTGDVITLRAFFDGWGYVHLYANEAGKMRELDTYAIPEATEPAFAEGFGDLSVHEAATSQRNSRIAYLSYYSGGFRVVRINENANGASLQEVGRFIDEGGSNFWGVEVFQGRGGREFVAASDRDFGLYIFAYAP